MKIRKRPVEVEGWQINTLQDALTLVEQTKHDEHPFQFDNESIDVHTLASREPEQYAEVWLVYDYLHDTWVRFEKGDWIIRGTKGEYYPCAQSVFSDIYEVPTADAETVEAHGCQIPMEGGTDVCGLPAFREILTTSGPWFRVCKHHWTERGWDGPGVKSRPHPQPAPNTCAQILGDLNAYCGRKAERIVTPTLGAVAFEPFAVCSDHWRNYQKPGYTSTFIPTK